ncbi:hypothetical protein [Nautilia lithotrophica]
MKEYKVVLRFYGVDVFIGFFIDLNNYRIVKDEIELESSIEKLLQKGKINLKNEKKIFNDYEFNRSSLDIKKIDSLDTLFKEIEKLGYEIVIEENYKNYFKLRAVGKSLHPHIISQTNDNRISKFFIELFKSSNNKTYEPPLKKSVGSFSVEVLDEINREITINFLSKMTNMRLEEKLFSKLEELEKIKDLEKIEIYVKEEKFVFSKENIKKIISFNKKLRAEEKTIIHINILKLRSLDEKNLSFKVDKNRVIIIKCLNERDFKQIRDYYFQQKKISVDLKGYFTSSKTFMCENIVLKDN